ncbi:MAG: DUF2203 domain-containing protein [Terriglobia bacterium]
MDFDRLFSVNEANALLPRLRELLAQVRVERERLLSLQPEIEKAQSLHIYDWGTPRGAEYIGIVEAYQSAVKSIEELGVLVKDLDIGLCDFPHKMGGKVVFLCWKQDEDEVAWWHDLEAGFGGRQPL